MSADVLLSRLERVKQTGPGRWLASCPAHQDKTPSLSLRELQDGRTLVHCFAQCSTEDVLAAVGLNFDALFPEKPINGDFRPRERKPFNAGDVLEAIADEVLIVAVAGTNLCQGALSSDDLDRALLAAERLVEARRLANG